MSQEIGQAELQERTQQLLNGPLKHIRAAALAAALLPLASVAAAPASAQDTCQQSAGPATVCGFVFNDTNGNGFQDAGETGIPDATVYLVVGGDPWQFSTGPDGFYYFDVPDGTYPIIVTVPQGLLTSPSPEAGDDTTDSDGDPDGFGNSVTTVTVVGGSNPDTDFGFFTPSVQRPGTGTPGYWKNHPEAWPVQKIEVGGVWYTKAQAIAFLGKVGKDKTMTMFSSLVPAMLNLMMGTDPSCVSSTIADANAWMATYPPGSNVAASSYAWSVGEPLHIWMDNYNNGRLCNPHRN